MPYPALAIQQPDMGRTLMQAEAIKGARTKNRLMQAEGERNQEIADVRNQLLGTTSSQDALTPAGPTMEAAGRVGQPEGIDFNGPAFRQYMSLDPEGAEQLLDMTAKLDDRQKTVLDEQVQETAKMLLWVEQQPDKNAAWQQVRAQADKMGLDMSDDPEQYDPAHVQREIMQALSVNEILEQQTAGATNDTRNFEYAENNPGFAAYQQNLRRSSATQVNVGPQGIDYGDPPKDMVWKRDQGSGEIVIGETGAPIAIPIEGGPVATGAAAAEEAAATAAQQRQKYADVVVDDIGRALEMVEASTIPITGIGAWTSIVPGTPSHDVAKILDTVRASVGFERLQQMRDASPTGGALGQVSERENTLLQASLGSLEQSQSKEQFVRNLQRVRDLYLDTIHGAGNWSFNSDGELSLKQATSSGDVAKPDFLTDRVWDAMTAEQRELFR